MPALTEGWYVAADGVAGQWTPLESAGRVIESLDGWDDIPGLRGDNAELAGRHGDALRAKKYEAAVKPLAVAVHGVGEDWRPPATGSAQRARYDENLDGLLRLLRYRKGGTPWLRVYADGSRRTALCEVLNAITPARSGYTYGLVAFDLRVPGAFWLDEDARPYELPWSAAGPDGQDLEVFNLAGQTGYCSSAVVTVTGPCTSVKVVDAETGSGFRYPTSLGSGQSLVVDVGDYSATVASSSVLTSLELFSTELLEISPGPYDATRGPSLTVTAPGHGSGFSVTVDARRAWLR